MYVIVMNSFIIKMSYARLVGSAAKNLILKLEPFAVLFFHYCRFDLIRQQTEHQKSKNLQIFVTFSEYLNFIFFCNDVYCVNKF